MGGAGLEHGGLGPSVSGTRLGCCSTDLHRASCSRLGHRRWLVIGTFIWVLGGVSIQQTPSPLSAGPPGWRWPLLVILPLAGDVAHRRVTWLCPPFAGLHGEGAGLAAGEPGHHPWRVCGRRCHRGQGPIPPLPSPPPASLPDGPSSADVLVGGRGGGDAEAHQPLGPQGKPGLTSVPPPPPCHLSPRLIPRL